jgi:hypothetical protein
MHAENFEHRDSDSHLFFLSKASAGVKSILLIKESTKPPTCKIIAKQACMKVGKPTFAGTAQLRKAATSSESFLDSAKPAKVKQLSA